MFGGLTETNDTLNDMWKFDIETNTWNLVEQKGQIPEPRCGHSLNLHGDKIFLFGGLKEVTQESNEIFKFDLNNYSWEEVVGDHQEESIQVSHNALEGYGHLKKPSCVNVNQITTPRVEIENQDLDEEDT